MIALVEAYDYPTAANDLAVFSSQFGLPAANLSIVWATGTKPPSDPFEGQWDAEQALDIEWAHAMAPKAKIFLVQAASQSLSDLLTAERVASQLVAAAGGGEVSNSWGYPEKSSYTPDDSNFTTPGIVYFASSGDVAFSLNYPSVSPNVIAAGGTSLQRNSSGDFTGETYWNNIYGGGGGGLSLTENRPSYQNVIASIVGTHRGVPDISSDADPLTGGAVYDSTPLSGSVLGWFQIGGTSVSSRPWLALPTQQRQPTLRPHCRKSTLIMATILNIRQSTVTSPWATPTAKSAGTSAQALAARWPIPRWPLRTLPCPSRQFG